MNKKTANIIKIVGFLAFVGIVCFITWKHSGGVGADRKGLGENFEFDMERYLKTDPALLLYREASAIPLSLKEVIALAVGPEDRLYVAGDRKVVILDAGGKELRQLDLPAVPTCVAVAADGAMYVGQGNRIVIYGADGRETGTWKGPAEDSVIASIVIRGDDVFAGEARQGQVLRFDRDGRIVSEFKGLVMFSSFHLGLAVDSAGRLWVANPGGRELRCYKDDGTIAVSWQKPARSIDGFSGCCNPTDIAIRADDAIVTSEKNIVRVKVVRPDGELVGVVAGPESFDPRIKHLDVAVDSKGRVLVLDPVRKAVRIFVEKTK